MRHQLEVTIIKRANTPPEVQRVDSVASALNQATAILRYLPTGDASPAPMEILIKTKFPGGSPPSPIAF